HDRLDFLGRNSGPPEQRKKLNKKKVVRAKVSSTSFPDVIPPGVLRKQNVAEISRLLHPEHQLYVLLRRGRRYAIEFDPSARFGRAQMQPGVRFILGVHPNETRMRHTMRLERRDLCHGGYAVSCM